MKKMILSFLILVVGLGVCGYLVHRHHRRTPAVKSPSGASEHRPMNQWQQGIQLDGRTDYTNQTKAERELHEKLRLEEQRQKPQEGRN